MMAISMQRDVADLEQKFALVVNAEKRINNMAFNYLQTDDRDDYLAQFGSKKGESNNPIIHLTLKDKNGNIILDSVASHKIRAYYKKTYLPLGKSAKKIWRKGLQELGYEVINNREF